MNIVNYNIQNLCIKNTITLKDLEKALGFYDGYLSKNPDRQINPGRIKAIADYFNISVEELKKDNGNPDMPEIYLYKIDKISGEITQYELAGYEATAYSEDEIRFRYEPIKGYYKYSIHFAKEEIEQLNYKAGRYISFEGDIEIAKLRIKEALEERYEKMLQEASKVKSLMANI